MRKVILPIAALILALSVALPVATPALAENLHNPHDVYELYAGQNIKVGYVQVTEDAENLYVEYHMKYGWQLVETHVAVAESLEGLPQNKKGNPKVGHFPYSADSSGIATIPRDSGWTAGTELYMAAHAVVYNPDLCQEETAWATDCGCDGFEFPGRNWAMGFIYTVEITPAP